MPRKKKMKTGDSVPVSMGPETTQILEGISDEINAANGALVFFSNQKNNATTRLWDILKELNPNIDWDSQYYIYKHKEKVIECVGPKNPKDFEIISKGE